MWWCRWNGPASSAACLGGGWHEPVRTFPQEDSTAPVARDRLQVLLAHERSVIGKSDLMATLQEEILAVIAKHITVDRDAVQIKLDRGDAVLDAGDRCGSAEPEAGDGSGRGSCLGLTRVGKAAPGHGIRTVAGE